MGNLYENTYNMYSNVDSKIYTSYSETLFLHEWIIHTLCDENNLSVPFTDDFHTYQEMIKSSMTWVIPRIDDTWRLSMTQHGWRNVRISPKNSWNPR